MRGIGPALKGTKNMKKSMLLAFVLASTTILSACTCHGAVDPVSNETVTPTQAVVTPTQPGWEPAPTTASTEEEAAVIKENEEILAQTLDFPEGSIITIADDMAYCGIGRIVEITIEKHGGHGTWIRIVDETNHVYYLGLSRHGFVTLVYKDRMRGEVIYVVD